MADDSNMLWFVGILVVLFFVFVYMQKGKGETFERGNQKSVKEKSTKEMKKKVIEGFTALAAGANNNSGILLDDSYDLIQSADQGIPAAHFSDLINTGQDHLKEYISQPRSISDNLRPTERLQRIQGKALMPRTSTYVTPFNVDVANPTSSKYMVNTPRVSTALKSRYKDYSASSYIRGDVPITYHPNICLISKTIQGRDDLRLDGLFTPHFEALYNKYTGKAYKNLVTQVSGAGVAGGYGGASGGVIMDNY